MDFGHLGVSSQEKFLNSKLISNVNYNRKVRENYIYFFKIVIIIKNFLYLKFYISF